MVGVSAPYQYIVLHQSLKNHVGALACQAAHAAGESCFDGPAPGDTHVCALVAETSADLVLLSLVLVEAGIKHVLINEPDEPYNGAATAVGIAPQDREVVRPFVAQFKVLR